MDLTDEERKIVEWRMERDRLRDAVVEATRVWRKAQGNATHVTECDGTRLVVVRAWFGLRKAVDALLEFEAKQGK